MVSILGDYSYEFPIRLRLDKRLNDLLENNVDEKYFLSDAMMEKISNWKGYENPLDDTNPNRVCSCLTTHCGKDSNSMQLVESLQIKNATKKGYLEANEGDGIDIGGRMETHRGTVQKGTSQTLKTSCDVGVVVGMYQYDKSDTFMKGKDRFQKDKKIADTLCTAPKEGVVLLGGIGEKKSNKGTQWFEQDRIYDSSACATALTIGNHPYYASNLRIRKLTPKECIRLMGFEDSDYESMKRAGLSDSAIYHCAGDSIVVPVLIAIFSQLFNQNHMHKKIIEKYLNY